MDSSKIKKTITWVEFDGKRTIITFGQGFTPSQAEGAINEGYKLTSDLPRHGDFERAMEKFKAHFLLRSFSFLEFKDKLGKEIDKVWFDEFLYENDPRFSDVTVHGIVITTKKDVTGFYINGQTLSVDDQPIKFKCPVISTLKVEGGYNYPLLTLADEHKDTLLLEAQEFLKYKNGNPQLRLAV